MPIKNINKNINLLTELDITKSLMTKDIPDPDFVIRTSGEMRLSHHVDMTTGTYNGKKIFTPKAEK